MRGIFIRERGGRLGYRDPIRMGPESHEMYLYKRKGRETWVQRHRGDTRRQEGHATMEAEIGVMHAATKPRRAMELQGLLGASRG